MDDTLITRALNTASAVDGYPLGAAYNTADGPYDTAVMPDPTDLKPYAGVPNAALEEVAVAFAAKQSVWTARGVPYGDVDTIVVVNTDDGPRAIETPYDLEPTIRLMYHAAVRRYADADFGKGPVNYAAVLDDDLRPVRACTGPDAQVLVDGPAGWDRAVDEAKGPRTIRAFIERATGRTVSYETGHVTAAYRRIESVLPSGTEIETTDDLTAWVYGQAIDPDPDDVVLGTALAESAAPAVEKYGRAFLARYGAQTLCVPMKVDDRRAARDFLKHIERRKDTPDVVAVADRAGPGNGFGAVLTAQGTPAGTAVHLSVRCPDRAFQQARAVVAGRAGDFVGAFTAPHPVLSYITL